MCKRRALIAVVGIALLVSPTVRAEEQSKETDYHKITDKFLAKLAEGNASDAVDYFFGLNPYMVRKADELAQLKSQVAGISSMFGSYQGDELLLEKNFGTRFVNITYLAFYERQPIRLNFQFYRVKNAWLTYSFTFEDRFAQELAEAAKAQSLVPSECGRNIESQKRQ